MSHYGQIDYQQALLNASKSMIRVKDPVMLLRLITRFIDRQIGATHVGVLLYEQVKKSYVLIDSKGESGRRIPIGFIRIPENDPLIMYFKEKRNGQFIRKEALIHDELEHLKNFQILVNKKEQVAVQIEDIKKQMELFRASVCLPSFYKQDLVAILMLGDKLTGTKYLEKEISLFVTLANDVAMAVKNAALIKDLKDAYEKEHELLIETSSALASAIEARDKYTKGHSERVSHYSLVVAAEMIDSGLVPYSREFLECVQLSALLHDVGKIGIRDTILNKPARLDEQEYSVMQSHVKIGAHILKPITRLKGLHDGVLYHHERWDGAGYPYGLKGEEIPLIGRIVCVVDSYDTMTTKRPYSKGMTYDEAITELRANAGTQFDPKIVEIFHKAHENGRTKQRGYKAYKFSTRN